MSRKNKKNPMSGFQELKVLRETGRPQPSPLPTFLDLKSIKVREEVFQHRRPHKADSARHVRGLAEVAKTRDLDPLTVWWDGKKWTVIDGHHRINAYVRAGKGHHAVPVEVYEGTPEEALGRAAEANTKDKLQMSSSEKSTAAWRLVVLTQGSSKAQQAQYAGVSERLIAMMRKARATLLSNGEHHLEALSEMAWNEARRHAMGAPDDWSPEEEEVRVEKMTTALRKALGATADLQPDIFMRAVERFSPRLAKAIEEAHHEAFLQNEEEMEEE